MHDLFDFSGTISGLDGNDSPRSSMDIMFETGTTSWTTPPTKTAPVGVLHVTDGTHEANINLLGQYEAGGFVYIVGWQQTEPW